MRDKKFTEEIYIERKILNELFKDWQKYGHNENYQGLFCISLTGKLADLKTVVRCIKFLINFDVVEGSGNSEYQGIPWQFVNLTAKGIALCQNKANLNEHFPEEPQRSIKKEIGFTKNRD